MHRDFEKKGYLNRRGTLVMWIEFAVEHCSLMMQDIDAAKYLIQRVSRDLDQEILTRNSESPLSFLFLRNDDDDDDDDEEEEEEEEEEGDGGVENDREEKEEEERKRKEEEERKRKEEEERKRKEEERDGKYFYERDYDDWVKTMYTNVGLYNLKYKTGDSFLKRKDKWLERMRKATSANSSLPAPPTSLMKSETLWECLSERDERINEYWNNPLYVDAVTCNEEFTQRVSPTGDIIHKYPGDDVSFATWHSRTLEVSTRWTEELTEMFVWLSECFFALKHEYNDLKQIHKHLVDAYNREISDYPSPA
eukprot:CAMPEP_0113882524 /NCGR_PEP_ID=MMETSP0780_2-20120614/9013_1 /TAXON_ID=652834 /ORGANISM="Palpitomonas bilix" /LENGTH=307 /DNA_ID=CAMNT_0000869569 /DNA_START=366 /DNA_END=1289 /DNA_ORIENTATION=+ /assembly_acc=CAM_ASM_000599